MARNVLDRWQLGAKDRLQLLAELASLPSLAGLSRTKKRQLVRLAKRASPLGVFTQDGAFLDGWSEECGQAWGPGTRPPIAWLAIGNAHELTYETVHRFLSGSPVDLRPFQQYEPTHWQFDRAREAGQPYFDSTFPGATLLAELAHIIRSPNFPLRRCPQCNTQAFVRKGKRKYCSISCTNKAAEAARKDNPQRKAKVRENMREYRQRKKARKTAP